MLSSPVTKARRLFILSVSIVIHVYSLIGQQNDNIPTPLHDTVSMSFDVETVVITSQFKPTDIRQTVQQVQVIDQKEIKRQGAVNLADILAVQPNVKINTDPILGGTLSINGMTGQNVKILIDGVPIVGRQNGNIDVNQILLAGVKRIELVQGAQSVMYGSDAAGGVINIITGQAQKKVLNSSLSSQIESQGLMTHSIGLGARSKYGDIHILGNMLDFAPDTIGPSRNQIWNPKQQKAIQSNLNIYPSQDLKISLQGRYLTETVQNEGSIIRPTFKPYAFDDTYKTQRSNYAAHIESTHFNDILIQGTIGYDRFDRIKNTSRINFDDGSNILVDGQQDTSMVNGLLSRFTLSGVLSKYHIDYLVGIENFFEKATGQRIVQDTDNPGIADINTIGLFANIKYTLSNNTQFQIGNRWTNNDVFGHAVTPAFSLAHTFNKKWNLKSSYSRAFRTPDLKELFFEFIDINHFVVGNINLKPESSHNILAQLVYNTKATSTKITLNADFFYNKIRDKIALIQTGNGTEFAYQNFYDWTTQGGLFGLAFQNKSFQWRTHIIRTGYFNILSEEMPNLDVLLWSTDVTSDLSIPLYHKYNIQWSIWYKFNGFLPQYVENEDREIMQGGIQEWHNLNTSLVCSPIHNLTLNLGVKNILNVRQIGFSAEGEFHQSTSIQRDISLGRNFFASIRYDLGK